jgi:glutamate racemase
LLDQGVKAIVVACNTATAQSLEALKAAFDVPIVGVIEPGSRAAVRTTTNHRVGVLGTYGTVNSGAYDRAIHHVDPSIAVTSKACPLFVPLAEEGLLDHEATRLIARDYLAPVLDADVDTVVLGCTHYPLLRPILQRLVGDRVQLVDSAEQTAAETGQMLREQGIANQSGEPVKLRFIASDLPEQFLRVGQRFLGAAIDRVETITLG